MKTTNMLTFVVLFLLFTVAGSAQQVSITPFDSNSEYDDFAPAFTNHGRVVVFTHEGRGQGQKLYSMERSSSGWRSHSRISGPVNRSVHSGAPSLTPDGQYMLFSSYRHSEPGNGRTDIYEARMRDGSWTEVKALSTKVNSSFYDSQPFLSSDGRTLFFVSDRPGGQGETDIYYSIWDGSTWSQAKPLVGVNSSAHEMSPSLAADGTTFYFASNRSGGAGGHDIYTGKYSSGAVTVVKSVGTPINSRADELFYSSLPNSDQAMFTRGNDMTGYDNYWVVPNPFPGARVLLVEGIVSNKITQEPVGALITVTDLTTGKAIATLRSDDRTGEYYVTLTAGRVYSITASAPGYLFHTERYEVPPDFAGETIRKDIALTPLQANAGQRLLVFFDFDKADLKNESFPELERVVEFLRSNPGFNIVFEGHTDDQGADDYNLNLSKRRAETVVDYVSAAGIDKNRLGAVGHGKRKPLVTDTTESARAMNRRVEMIIKGS